MKLWNGFFSKLFTKPASKKMERRVIHRIIGSLQIGDEIVVDLFDLEKRYGKDVPRRFALTDLEKQSNLVKGVVTNVSEENGTFLLEISRIGFDASGKKMMTIMLFEDEMCSIEKTEE